MYHRFQPTENRKAIQAIKIAQCTIFSSRKIVFAILDYKWSCFLIVKIDLLGAIINIHHPELSK